MIDAPIPVDAFPLLERFVRRLNVPKNRAYADLASCNAPLLRQMATWLGSNRVVAVEPRLPASERDHWRCPRLEFQDRRFHQPSPDAERFAVVSCFDVLSISRDPFLIVQRALGSLTQGGTAIIVVPDPSGWRGWSKRAARALSSNAMALGDDRAVDRTTLDAIFDAFPVELKSRNVGGFRAYGAKLLAPVRVSNEPVTVADRQTSTGRESNPVFS
ncbi:MAG: hypothetical protein ACFB6S_04300 [Geminicoccaceae bacterium]